jgi:two-component system NtrC family sensor kinase
MEHERIISSSSSDLDSADRALQQRPKLTIRLRVFLCFMLTCLLIGAITISAIVFLSKLGAKQLFIEKADSYMYEIQQARRFEKNYLLYGTDLPDARLFVENARNVLGAARQDFCAIIGQAAYARMSANLGHYHDLLAHLEQLAAASEGSEATGHDLIQAELRRSGAELVADAADVIDRERVSFHSWLHTSKIIAVSVLVLSLLLETFMVAFITRQIFLPLHRFENYMQRIAAGDFSPIWPVKRFQDEFTDLALAVNRMLKEIQDRGNQLAESRKMAAVGTLTAGIAHEINNPLNNISLTAEALIDEFQMWSDEEKLEMLKDIFSQVERAGATVANLLDFTHRDQSAFKSIAIPEVLDSTAALLKNELLLAHITLNMRSDDPLPRVRGHHQNLQQAFLNLFLNAIEAMPSGGELTVRCGLEDGTIRVDVSDTGVGIPEEHRERIFDPFFTTKAVGKGTGLGLAVTFGIVAKHHGTIHVDSRPGQGATFTVLLPAA